MVRIVGVNGRLVQRVVVGEDLVITVEVIAGNADAQRVGSGDEVNAVGGIAVTIGAVERAAAADPLFDDVGGFADAGALEILIPGAGVRHDLRNDRGQDLRAVFLIHTSGFAGVVIPGQLPFGRAVRAGGLFDGDRTPVTVAGIRISGGQPVADAALLEHTPIEAEPVEVDERRELLRVPIKSVA